MIKIEIYTKHRVRRDNFKGVTVAESLEKLCKVEGIHPILIHVATLLDSHIPGTVSCKIYKHGPTVITEPHRSIDFNINFIRAAEPHSPLGAQGVQMTAAVEDSVIPTHGEFATLKALGGEAVERLRLRVEEIELAPWQPLLTKLENFNELMTGISEVS